MVWDMVWDTSVQVTRVTKLVSPTNIELHICTVSPNIGRTRPT